MDDEAKNLNELDEITRIHEVLQKRGIALTKEADKTTIGPEYITLTDSDGNNILIDQHR